MRNLKQYRWSSPHDWLDDHCATADVLELRSVIRDLLSKLTGDDLQDLFQTEMDADGYFRPLEPEHTRK
jgi:hypothetical protein